jgi:hypothetical protein
MATMTYQMGWPRGSSSWPGEMPDVFASSAEDINVTID